MGEYTWSIYYDSRLSQSSGGAHLGNRRYGKIQALFYGSIRPIFIITEGYKLFDIIFFDYLMLTKFKIPSKIYPETAGVKGYNNFGFNAKSQVMKLVVFCGISLILAFVLTVIIPLWL